MANEFLATDEFFGSLDTVGQVAQSLSTPAALAPSQLSITNAISCASVVLLSGYFEYFLKEIIREYIEEINLLRKPLADIPYAMQVKHYAGGADALAWASKQDKDLKIITKSQDLSQRLGSLGSTTGNVLAWEAFANTKSNPGTDTVAALLSGLQIEKTWTQINGLQALHGRLDTFLDTFIKMRNVCAHTGRHHTPPSGGDIEGYVETFRALAECMDVLMKLKLDQFK